MEGGWGGKNSEINYGILIQGNKNMGLEVQKNSVLDVDYMKLGGSGSNEGNSQINDDGWHQTSLEIKSLSFGKIEDSIIEGNLGQALTEHGGKKAHLLGKLDVNHWQGRKSPQLIIEDAAWPEEL